MNCVIGVPPEERSRPQKIEADIFISTDTGPASRSDSVEDTIDYGELASKVVFAAENSSFRLLESLARLIADICLAQPTAKEVRIEVRKPGAIPKADWAAVEIVRKS
jgi:dihydroneopterin aldolase/D-erythro-7,8-dihydroneopterin triphosphate epimerase